MIVLIMMNRFSVMIIIDRILCNNWCVLFLFLFFRVWVYSGIKVVLNVFFVNR